jgi:two-component sensor histidine kinase
MWKPIHLDFILGRYEPFDKRVIFTLIGWILLIAGTIYISLSNLPSDWIKPDGNKNELLKIFILNPPMVLGLLILFWFGFEWSFIIVFMSMFVIGVFSSLDPFWAILFGLSFTFTLSIYAIVYHCLNFTYNLRTMSSVILFVGTSFVASTASSLGTFIWSLEHNLNASETIFMWNGWWSGSFLQTIFIIAPLLYLLSPSIESWKEKVFEFPEKKEVSTKWIYSTVILITVVISVFIFSGDYLAKKRISEQVNTMTDLSSEAIITSIESFGIITWVSIWIIFCVGIGAVYLISSWNTGLKTKVAERTESLITAEAQLKESLEEKETLLNEIHHRVKNNLAVVIALLDLQYMQNKDEKIKTVLIDAKARIKSMSFVHQTLYQTENFSKVDIAFYLQKLCKSIQGSLKTPDKEIEIDFTSDEIKVPIEKAIPLGLLINEMLVNSYKHAFEGRDKGVINISLTQKGKNIIMAIVDDGIGFTESESEMGKSSSLGMKLIKTLTRQLRAELDINSEPGRTSFELSLSL